MVGAILKTFIELPLAKRRLAYQQFISKGVKLNQLTLPRFAKTSCALSYAQGRLWFLWHLEPESTAYNMPAAVRLRGLLDEAALGKSFDALVVRHETLRTTFVAGPDGRGLQHIHAAGPVSIGRVDLSGLEDLGEREQEARRLASVEAGTSFDLEKGPLLRVQLLHLGEDDHVLLVNLHHIVGDGWSTDILVEEFAAFYGAYSRGEEPRLPELAIQYADYAVWQRAWLEAGEGERQLAYWRQKLGDDHPVLELPSDRPRPAEQSYRGSSHGFTIEAALMERLRRLGQRHNATLFMVLLAAFKALLYRYTGQRDLRIGVPNANRNRVETEGLIGFFVNTQVLRTELDGRWSFVRLVEAVRETSLEAQAHQDLPFEQLVEVLQPERSLAHSPLFQVLFNHLWETDIRKLQELPGLRFEGFGSSHATTKFDLMFFF